MYFQFFKCRRIFSFNSFIVFISVINLIILLIDKFITVMYFSARNSVERLQGVYFLINVIYIYLFIGGSFTRTIKIVFYFYRSPDSLCYPRFC